MTKEEKMLNIQQAEELYRQAFELFEKAEKLITKGVKGNRLIDGFSAAEMRKDGTIEIHVYERLRKLAKTLETETEVYKDYYFNEPDKSRIQLIIGGIKFFQIGRATESKYCFK